MTDNSRRAVIGALLALAPGQAFAQFTLPKGASGVLNGMLAKPGAASGTGAAGASLSQNEIGLGLKDALKVAASKVIGQVGKQDGYFADPAIRIPLPASLQKVAGPLRAVGAAGLLDDLTLRMNRGAEQAAPKALGIFTDAATSMSFDDARAILTGPQDSATQYFKRTTSGNLTTAFTPIVNSSLAGSGALRVMKSLQDRVSSGMPLLAPMIGGFDITSFTVGKALDGLFHYMAVEEGNIRANPVARTTDLLKKVFR